MRKPKANTQRVAGDPLRQEKAEIDSIECLATRSLIVILPAPLNSANQIVNSA